MRFSLDLFLLGSSIQIGGYYVYRSVLKLFYIIYLGMLATYTVNKNYA